MLWKSRNNISTLYIVFVACSRFGVNSYNAMRRLFEGNPYSVSELEKIKEEKTANTTQ